jgi:hypothetical protein
MTVATTASAVQYVGDGTTSTFIGTFPCMSESDIYASIDGVNASFTITGDATEPNAWSITLAGAPAVDSIIFVYRRTPKQQLTSYTPYGRYQAKQHESDFDRALMISQEVDRDVQVSDDTKADKSTRIITSNPSTLSIASPSLADDVNITVRTNIPNGVAGLDGSGKVPVELLPTTPLIFRGLWSPANDGATPPASGVNGYFYIFETPGNMTLRTNSNTVPHTVAVLSQDYMIYQDADPFTSNPAGWYFVARVTPTTVAQNVSVSPPIPGLASNNVYDALDELNQSIAGSASASSVSFVPTGSLSSTNVQAALAELDADVSTRFYESGQNALIRRGDGTLAIGTGSSGGVMYNASGVGVASWNADGVVSLVAQSALAAALARRDFVLAQIAAALPPKYMSPNQAFAAAGAVNHGLGVLPSRIGFNLICVTAQHGYSINDVVAQPTIAVGGSTYGLQVWANTTQIGFSRGTVPLYIIPKGGGAGVQITEANWRIRLLAEV